MDAKNRLQALKQRLTDLAAGKTPGAAPAAAPAAPAPTQPAQTSSPTPADPKLAGAAAELARIDAAVEAMSPGDKVKGQQYVNELNKVAETLKAFPNRNDPDWKKAAQHYDALNKKVVAKANAPAPAGAAAIRIGSRPPRPTRP